MKISSLTISERKQIKRKFFDRIQLNISSLMLLQFAWGFSSKLFGFKCLSPTTTDEHTYCQLKIFNFILAHFECRSVCIKHTHTKVRRNCWKVMEWNFYASRFFFIPLNRKCLNGNFMLNFNSIHIAFITSVCRLFYFLIKMLMVLYRGCVRLEIEIICGMSIILVEWRISLIFIIS